MAELIKEVTPPKRPDVSNPYQTASPVGKVGPPKARSVRRPRATGKPLAPGDRDDKEKLAEKKNEKKDEEKELEQYSPQAIIEATVPKVKYPDRKSA